MKFLKFLKFLKRVTGSGLVKPLPGSGIVDEISETVKEIKQNNNYKRLYRLGAYLISGFLFWYMLSKGMTIDRIEELIGLVKLLGF